MNIAVEALDLLPETDPVATADLDGTGLLPCLGTCLIYTLSCLITI